MSRKLLFFNQSQEIGGTDTFLISLIKAWPAADTLSVWCNHDHKGIDLYKNLGVNLERITFPTIPVIYDFIHKYRVPFIVKKIYRVIIFLLKPIFFLFAAYLFYKKLKKENFEILFSSNGGYPGGEMCQAIVIAAKLAGVKRIFLIIHNKPLVPKLFYIPWAILVDRLISISCTEIISVSQSCARQVESIRYFNKKIKLIYYGIETETVERLTLAEKRKVIGLNGRCKVIGCIGNYEKRKGHEYLIRAFSEVKKIIPDTTLVIIGSDASLDAKDLNRLVDELNLRSDIYLTGYLANARDFIECFDVFVLPSVAYESFGLVILEAMLYKKAVVGTSVDGIPEAVQDAGFFVEPANPNSLAERIIYLLNHPDKAKELGEKGFHYLLNRFNSVRMAREYCKLTG